MTHQEMQEMYEFYVLGLLEPAEREEIEEHLRAGCLPCQAALRRAAQTNAAILSFAPEAEPPKDLRKRVLASFGAHRPSWGWIAGWGVVTAGLLIAALWSNTDAQRLRSELAGAQRQVSKSEADAAHVQSILDFLNAPDTRPVSFGKGPEQPPRGTLFVNPSNGVLLMAANLPPLEPGKTYEMWLIPKGGSPRPAGLFQSDAQGRAIHLAPGPVDPATSAVAVSVEPESGSTAPTTTPIVVAPVAL